MAISKLHFQDKNHAVIGIVEGRRPDPEFLGTSKTFEKKKCQKRPFLARRNNNATVQSLEGAFFSMILLISPRRNSLRVLALLCCLVERLMIEAI